MIPRRDPTRTSTLRARYSSALTARFELIRRDIVTSIVDRDALGLTKGVVLPAVLDAARVREFDFPTSEAKVQAFIRWLRRQTDKGILEVIRRDGEGRITARSAWQNVYIRSAYQEGIRRARRELARQGERDNVDVSVGAIQSAFNQPLHADRAGLLFTRNFEELEGITNAMSQAISRTLAQGMIEGRSPREIARQISKRVDGIGKVRADLLARTEIIRAHAEATLNEYETHGARSVAIEAEFSTAGDARVCPQCASLEGKVFSITAARGLIPQHPRCRCAWIPANVGEGRGDKERRRAQLIRQGFRFPRAA